jgi:hypothetical protein
MKDLPSQSVSGELNVVTARATTLDLSRGQAEIAEHLPHPNL